MLLYPDVYLSLAIYYRTDSNYARQCFDRGFKDLKLLLERIRKNRDALSVSKGDLIPLLPPLPKRGRCSSSLWPTFSCRGQARKEGRDFRVFLFRQIRITSEGNRGNKSKTGLNDFFLKSTTHHLSETYLLSVGNHRWSFFLTYYSLFRIFNSSQSKFSSIRFKDICNGDK